MRMLKKSAMAILGLIAGLSSFSLSAQIPSGYVQTTATVSSLAGGQFGASWTNLSSSPQLGLLGCVSTFQQTINGTFDASGHFSTLLADPAQICPSPSTWSFAFTYSCPAGSPNSGFALQLPTAVLAGFGGSTVDISSQITAALPANPCNGSVSALYCKLTGCTMTGALTGTSASFSGNVGAGSANLGTTSLTGALTGTSASFSGNVGAGSANLTQTQNMGTGYTNTQNISINGGDVESQFAQVQGPMRGPAEGLSVAMNVNNSVTNQQPPYVYDPTGHTGYATQQAAIGAYVEVTGGNSYAVPIYAQELCYASNVGSCFGMNIAIQDEAGITATQWALEIDQSLLGSPANAGAILINGMQPTNTPPAGSAFITMATPHGYQQGVLVQTGALSNATNAALSIGANTYTSSPSYQIAFASYNAGGAIAVGTIYEDSNAYFRFNASNGYIFGPTGSGDMLLGMTTDCGLRLCINGSVYSNANIQANTFSGNTSATCTIGGVVPAGTGATCAITAGHVSDELSGDFTATTGTGTLTAGLLATINLGTTRATSANCIAQGYSLNNGTPLPLYVTTDTAHLMVNTYSAPTVSWGYAITYMCGGK